MTYPSNSGDEIPTENATTQTVAAGQLRAFIERIERLHEERKELADQIADIYGEARGMGYDVKAMKKVIEIRKKDPHQRAEEEAMVDLYLATLGMA